MREKEEKWRERKEEWWWRLRRSSTMMMMTPVKKKSDNKHWNKSNNNNGDKTYYCHSTWERERNVTRDQQKKSRKKERNNTKTMPLFFLSAFSLSLQPRITKKSQCSKTFSRVFLFVYFSFLLPFFRGVYFGCVNKRKWKHNIKIPNTNVGGTIPTLECTLNSAYFQKNCNILENYLSQRIQNEWGSKKRELKKGKEEEEFL